MSIQQQPFTVAVLLTLVGLFLPTSASSFPPYRSTDAETADPWIAEARLGVFKIENDDGENAYSSPLARLNFGFPGNLEIVSEFAYEIDPGAAADAAVGFKWAPVQRRVQLGVETLVLLPVSSDNAGLGIESQLLATYKREEFRVHVNAGGFHDARPEVIENGWRSSLLTEVTALGRFSPGVEIFAKQVGHEDVEVIAGPGFILDLGRFDIRAAVHLGLTEAAPDSVASLWFSAKFPFRKQNRASHDEREAREARQGGTGGRRR